MNPNELHKHVVNSIQRVRSAEDSGLCALLESGGVERFLTDLLFLELHSNGLKVGREHPSGNGSSADLFIHGGNSVVIEVKQLHLKDGCKYAVSNLTHDLKRHASFLSLGVIYVVDERGSTSEPGFSRYRGANRTAKYDPNQLIPDFKKAFSCVYPDSLEAALVGAFHVSGIVKLYAFVVFGFASQGDFVAPSA